MAVMQRTIFTSRDIIGPERSRPRYHVSGKPVFLFPKSRSENKTLDIWLHSTSDRPAPLDSTLSLGAVHDPVMVKLMDKVIDRQNRTAGTYDQLGDNDKRVRIEVTLNNQELLALGIKEVADLRRYTYVSLQGRCFQFKLPTFIELKCMGAASSTAVKRELEERRLKRFLSTGVVGLLFRQHSERVNRSIHLPELKRQFRMDGRKMTRNRRGGGANGTFVAYERLNRVVSDALWGLAKRERTAWKEQETR
ncbi:MAG: hypothetical protein KDK08_26725 [Rhizobiaceae bacterium]|nr:hypothetical protein [Rhizobiaceae bacterium]